jgi:glycogen operon protein
VTEVWPGQPFPLGAVWDGSGTNFSLFSEHAEAVELCLFDEEGEETRVPITQRQALNWHCYLPAVLGSDTASGCMVRTPPTRGFASTPTSS